MLILRISLGVINRHITTSLYHKLINELPKRAVQAFKQVMKMTMGSSPLDARLTEILLAYWLAPDSSTGHSLSSRVTTVMAAQDMMWPDTAQIFFFVPKLDRTSIMTITRIQSQAGVDNKFWPCSILDQGYHHRVPWSSVLLQDGKQVHCHVDHHQPYTPGCPTNENNMHSHLRVYSWWLLPHPVSYWIYHWSWIHYSSWIQHRVWIYKWFLSFTV